MYQFCNELGALRGTACISFAMNLGGIGLTSVAGIVLSDGLHHQFYQSRSEQNAPRIVLTSFARNHAVQGSARVRLPVHQLEADVICSGLN